MRYRHWYKAGTEKFSIETDRAEPLIVSGQDGTTYTCVLTEMIRDPHYARIKRGYVKRA